MHLLKKTHQLANYVKIKCKNDDVKFRGAVDKLLPSMLYVLEMKKWNFKNILIVIELTKNNKLFLIENKNT